MSEAIITANRLVKTYGQVRALDGLSLEVPQGTIHGLLGPNGAGKTTLIRMLATLLRADAGTAHVAGFDVIAAYWKQFIDGFPDAKYQYLNKIEAGNKAIDEGWFECTNTKPVKLPSGETMPATGKHIRLRSCGIATVENGR